MAKIQIRNERGNASKTIEQKDLEAWVKLGWGKVVVGKPVEVTVGDFDKTGKPIRVKQKQTLVSVEYAVSSDVKAKDAEIERLKAELAKAK